VADELNPASTPASTDIVNTIKVVPKFLERDSGVTLNCNVHLPDFEGPLDLLLYLIKNHELDLRNLPIAAITRQYLDYLNYMRELNLDLASEYLVMAATLTYLKSQIILPKSPEEEETGNDPKTQLIRRLIELNNYKELARALSEQPRLFRDVFPCRNTGGEEIEASLEPEVALSNSYQLLESYKALLERRKEVVHHVVTDEVPIAYCVGQIVNHLKTTERVTFQQLLPQTHRLQDQISMFLAILEMSRLQCTTIDQENIFGPIYINRKVTAEEIDVANELIRGGSWN